MCLLEKVAEEKWAEDQATVSSDSRRMMGDWTGTSAIKHSSP